MSDFKALDLLVVKGTLTHRGIHLDVGACGCCQGPWIKIAIDGVVVLDTEATNFDNFPEDAK